MNDGLEGTNRGTGKTARVLGSLLIIAVGVGAMVALVKMKPKTARKPEKHLATLVSVVRIEPSGERAVVRGMGTVVPVRSVVVMPEVSGRVVEVGDELVPGGRFEEGGILARIDDRDYRAAVAQQQANVERARFELKVESGRGAVAAKEWKLIGKDVATSDEGRGLALREPHMKNAKAALKAAESALATARHNLERTRIRAPFNSLVQSEDVDAGQVVGPGSRVATLVGTDAFRVQASIAVSELNWIDVPKMGAEKGSKALVFQETGNSEAQARKGRVVRLLGDLDPVGRMARVLIEVDDPLGTGGDLPDLPLLLGSYVRVEISGRRLTNVLSIPREALRDGERVYVMDGEDRLDIRPVEVVRRTDGRVLVRNGLKRGDRLVTSRIDTPVQGMPLRLEGAGEASK